MDTETFYLACHHPGCRRLFLTRTALRIHRIKHRRTKDMDEKEIRTADGAVVRKGDVVFNYYDQWWGRITEDPDRDGWFNVQGEGQRALLNGERISTIDFQRNTRPSANLTEEKAL